MRKALGGLTIILLLVGLSLAAALWWAQRALADAGVQQLEWQGLAWRDSALEVQRVSLVFPGGRAQLEQLRLQPGWRDGLRIRTLTLARAHISLEAAAAEPEPAAGMPAASLTAPELWSGLIDWLPDHLHVTELVAQVPCRAVTCELIGSLQASRTADFEGDVVANAELAVQAGQQTIVVRQQLQAGSSQLSLEGRMLIDGGLAAQLQSDWQGQTHWRGNLRVPEWPQTDGLYQYLGRWLSLGSLPIASLPPGARLLLDWDLHSAQPPVSWADWLRGEAAMNAQLALPQPWPIEQLGALSGELQLELKGEQGRWQIAQGRVQLLLDEPQLAVLDSLPGDLQPQQLELQASPAASTRLAAGEAMAFAATLTLAGAQGLDAQLKGDLALRLSPAESWQLELLDTQLALRLGSWQKQGILLQGLHMNAPLSGMLDSQGATLQAGNGAQLGWVLLQVAAAELDISDASLKLNGLSYQQQWQLPDSLHAEGRLSGNLAKVEQPQLKSQRWSLDGRWQYDDGELQWQGQLGNAAELALDTELTLPPAQPWHASATLPPLFFRAGNPLAATLASWPELLSLASGQLGGAVQASGGRVLNLRGDFNLDGVKGIYDRSAFTGLSAPVVVTVHGETLQIASNDLQLQSLNPGLEMGPLRAAASYRASMTRFSGGQLQLDRAQLQLLGGQISAEPSKLDFAATEQRLVLQLSGLELGTLFEVYPTEGLSGRGTLDGRLPVLLRDGELVVDTGTVAAREPGGVLRYESDKLQQLAQSNAGMRELAGALENFHYTVLSSQVDYAEDGTLQLGLRLQGSNPNFQQGRQVNLNVNLQENIPALLTSLQLSSQVSDIIQQRVQQHLLKQRLPANEE
ncbi:MAG: YdbH domain-containing protein [Halopseudomonas sp.]|uniref:YdbH domain-containing protein n=1 Tax=Halopseudomonas sp. TaxID=2901191 RepID=UPI0030027EF2